MSLENIKSSIKKLKNASLENCLRLMLDKMETQEKTKSQLQREVREKYSKLQQLRCIIEALEERVGKQGQYSSKDIIIIDNLPIYDVNLPLLGSVLKFFECFLDYRLKIREEKACHLLPKESVQSSLYISTTR